MRIALDAMGTNDAPAIEVAGACRAIRELGEDLEVVLVGDRDLIEAELKKVVDLPEGRLTIEHASERIDPGESPAAAVRRKRDSSIVVGLGLQKAGKVDAFISAGSTGAVMAASLFMLRPLPGVYRPAIGAILPTAAGPTLLVDAGANVDCGPEQLLQFALIGRIYAQDLMGLSEPRIALLNIGEEPEKGNEVSVEAHRLLLASELNFIGNIEGRDIIRGECDVLVCDGFVGNVLLKFYESMAEFTIGLLREGVAQSHADLELEKVLQVLDYSEYGGAPLLGVNGVSIICHGESNQKAIRNALGVAAQAVSAGMVGHIARELSQVHGTH